MADAIPIDRRHDDPGIGQNTPVTAVDQALAFMERIGSDDTRGRLVVRVLRASIERVAIEGKNLRRQLHEPLDRIREKYPSFGCLDSG